MVYLLNFRITGLYNTMVTLHDQENFIFTM